MGSWQYCIFWAQNGPQRALGIPDLLKIPVLGPTFLGHLLSQGHVSQKSSCLVIGSGYFIVIGNII